MLSDINKEIPLDYKNTKKFKIDVNIETFSVHIYYDWKEEIELENIFLILKSYVLSKEILIKNLYVIGSSENLIKNNIKPNFFRSINLNKIEKINFFDFSLFYDEMIQNDTHFYLNNYDFYGFVIIIMKESEIWENKKFYPIYPWNLNFKNMYISKIKNIREINRLKRENSILKKKIKYSVYRDGKRIWNFTKRSNSNRKTNI